MNNETKVLYIDVETTGTNAECHGIIQVAAIMEIAGIVVEEFDMKCAPHIGASIDREALAVSGTSEDELRSRQSSHEAFRAFEAFLERHVDRYNRNDKCYPAGYNARFDFQFVQEWFRLHGDTYGVGSFVNWRFLDPLPLLFIKDFKKTLSLPDYRLETVARHFQIPLNAHDAQSDIKATRAILIRLLEQ